VKDMTCREKVYVCTSCQNHFTFGSIGWLVSKLLIWECRYPSIIVPVPQLCLCLLPDLSGDIRAGFKLDKGGELGCGDPCKIQPQIHMRTRNNDYSDNGEDLFAISMWWAKGSNACSSPTWTWIVPVHSLIYVLHQCVKE